MPRYLKRLLWALGISLAVHLALIFGAHLKLPEPRPATVIHASLNKPQAAAKLHAPARPKKAAKKKIAPKAVAEEPPPSIASAPESIPSQSGDNAPGDAQQDASGGEGVSLPPQVEIRYILYKGSSGFSVGQAVQTWQIDGSSYILTSVMEATGLFSLFVPGKLVQTSQGEITPQGLRPQSYWIQRGQADDSTESAQFDWEGATLTFGSEQNRKTVALPENTQDFLSFQFQFAFSPPQPGSFKLPLTNGKKLDTYEYQVVGEETLNLYDIPMRTVHISKLHNPGEEGTEIWLAVDHYYLPVKVQHIYKSGGTAEQIANEIIVK